MIVNKTAIKRFVLLSESMGIWIYPASRLVQARDIAMALIRIYKRNSTFVELTSLVEELSNIGLAETLEKYYNKPFEHEARSIVAGPSFMQFLNKLFKTQIAAGDILQFESGEQDKYFMFSLTGTWDEIIKLQ